MYKRGVPKKDIDEKKKKEESEQEAAKAFQEFVEVFDEKPASQGKVWVKAGTFNAGSREETSQEKGKLYIPKSRFDPAPEKRALTPDKEKNESDKPNSSKKKETKKKSNLEMFKDELKRIQEEREERHRIKSQIGALAQILTQQQQQQQQQPRDQQQRLPQLPLQAAAAAVAAAAGLRPAGAELTSLLSLETNNNGSFDTGDPCTTNVYLGNLAPSMSEQRLIEVFGKFGALASIKIMWPRTDDERQRGRNCGFVAFMNRVDAEVAMEGMTGKTVDGFEMRMGWGKAVPLPQVPIFVPPALLAKLDKPPPLSGLPFNAQPHRSHKDKLPPLQQEELEPLEDKELWDQILLKAVVKVVVPTDRLQLHVINRCIEFVIREGPMFEAIIMSREAENPQYKFLFDNKSANHVYYRWKLFSMLQGDTVSRWNTARFRMFKGGSIWEPPKLNPYSNFNVQPRRLAEEVRIRGFLSDSQRSRFESQLRHMTAERHSVGEAMVWCLDHADSAQEICNCITESLSNPDTRLPSKIARLYLVCDLLHNSTARVSQASKFRGCIQEKLPEIFGQLHKTLSAQQTAARAEQFKQRVLRVLSAWHLSTVYPVEFLIALQSAFIGITEQSADDSSASNGPAERDPGSVDTQPGAGCQAGAGVADVARPQDDSEDDEDVDGVPLDGAALLKQAAAQAASDQAALSQRQRPHESADDDEDDVDGVPLEELEQTASKSATTAAPAAVPAIPGGFVPSRWETVDPDDVAAGVVTTSKWDQLTSVSADDDKGDDLSDGEESATPAAAAALSSATPDCAADNGLEDVGDDDDDVDGVPLADETVSAGARSAATSDVMSPESMAAISEQRRQNLRNVELMVTTYRDDLESGQRPVKTGYTLDEQVDHYRSKLVKKMERKMAEGRRRRSDNDRDLTPSDFALSASGTSSHASGASVSASGGGGGSGSRHKHSISHRSRSRSPDLERGKRQRRRSRSRSSSRRRRRSRSPPVTSSSGGRSSRSPPLSRHRSRSRSPLSYHSRSRSRSPSRKSSRRKSRR